MLRAFRLTSSDQQNNPSCVNAARRDPKHSIENHQDILPCKKAPYGTTSSQRTSGQPSVFWRIKLEDG